MTGNYVRVVQYYLAVIGENIDTVPEIAVDGIYGPQTAEAVRAFQREYGLPVTGVVDAPTWNTAYKVYRGIVESTPQYYTGVPAAPYPGFILSIGMQGNEVRLLQEYLSKLSEVYDEIPPINVDGVFGAATRDAVIAAQRLFGLPVTGLVDVFTWDEIVNAYRDVVSGENAAEGQFGGTTLR